MPTECWNLDFAVSLSSPFECTDEMFYQRLVPIKLLPLHYCMGTPFGIKDVLFGDFTYLLGFYKHCPLLSTILQIIKLTNNPIQN